MSSSDIIYHERFGHRCGVLFATLGWMPWVPSKHTPNRSSSCLAGGASETIPFRQQLRRRLQQGVAAGGPAAAPAASPAAAPAGTPQRADLPDCDTPWSIFNSSQELSFFASALQTVGLSGTRPLVPAHHAVAPSHGPFASLVTFHWFLPICRCSQLSIRDSHFLRAHQRRLCSAAALVRDHQGPTAR